MEIKNKKIIWLVIGVLTVFLLFNYFDMVTALFGYIGNLLLPVITGLVLAFVLSVPVTGFDNLFARMFAKAKRRPSEKLLHMISIILTLVAVVLIFTLLFTLMIPELVRTVKSVAAMVEERWPTWVANLEKYNIDTSSIKSWFAKLDVKSIVEKLTSGAGTLIGSIADATTTTVSGISSFIIGFIIAIYVLSDGKNLARQSRKLLYAYAKPAAAEKMLDICSLVRSTYTKFFTGQCLEAVLLGVLVFVSFLIFRLPYAGLIGTVTAICAIIPYVGAFLSCTLAVILTLMDSPEKAITCLIVYLAVQFIETQFIYPRVVGGSVGLSPLWTLVAAIIGGKLFGLLGMIFFVPLVSVVYILIREDSEARIKRKKEEKIIPKKMKF